MELIRMEKITKIYPGTTALSAVDFTLHEQEIVSLLGENGAGKTTLMKILYGMTPQSSGEIFYRGKPIRFRKPVDAIEKGICMVHQHFMLVPAFTVTENIIAGSEPSKNKFLDMKKARQQVKDLISQFHFNIDPDVKVEKLSVGEQQRVEILKVLYRKADVIILDEPTAVLTPSEVDDLFVILKRLRDEGKSIIIITHKLKETKALADRVVVLRDGRLVVDDVNPADVTTKQLSEMMVGREVNLQKRRPAEHIGEVCVHLEHLTVKEDGQEKVKDVSFDIRHGEILGIAGIEGNGQSQLIEALTGLREPESMKMTLNGKEVTGNCRDFLQDGIGHIPEDRLSMGLVKEMSIMDNMILGYHRESDFCRKSGLLEKKSIFRYAQKLKDKFQVKAPNVEAAVSSLSGGNQQKIIIARAFSRDPKAIIIAHPTRGVDIGAMEYIHSQLIELRDQGAAILLISADLDEVRTLSDRLLVIYEGEIVSESMPGELDEVEMGLLMTGGHTMVEKEVQA
ncbi:ABC transporter ATP-binding protein [Enterocloster citroniae]|uniref:ABC transporter ATP-binding protein n=1 Tax=Enterocloster citroniae TaxID=358743 RepID=UPI001898C054|nr:ABC transporter ATP-binding protein [Enterocloster citroniae]